MTQPETGSLNIGMATKVSLLCCALVIITALSLSVWLLAEFNEQLVERKSEQLSADTNLRGSSFQIQIDELIRDVRLLAGTPPVQGIIRTSQNDGVDPKDGSSLSFWYERLQTIFSQMLEVREDYLQIRYIGVANNGRELVRVDRADSSSPVRVIEAAQLQEKSNSKYYQEAIQKPEFGISLSDINLNREYGKISEPFIPVLRASITIYDEANNVFGFVIINKNLNITFSNLVNSGEKSQQYFITDENGEYLYHPDASRTYRYEFGSSARIQHDLSGLDTAFFTNGGATTTLITPAGEQAENIISLRKVYYAPDESERYIIIALQDTMEQVTSVIDRTRKQSLLILIVLILIAITIALVFASQLMQPINSMANAIQEFSFDKDMPALPTGHKDEVGVLARAFTEMIERIRERDRNLHIAQDRIKAVLDNAADVILAVESDGTLLSVNRAAQEIFGYTAEEMIGRNIVDFVVSDQPEGDVEPDQLLPDALKSNRSDMKGRHKSGTRFDVEMSVSELKNEFDRGYIAIIRDISERKKSEEQLLRSNQELEQFAYVASHDLQEPLRMVSSYTQLLQQRYNDKLDDDAREFISYAVDGAQRMQSLIQDLLLYSRLDKNAITFTHFDLNISFDNSLENLKVLIEENDAIVQADHLPVVYGDQIQIQQLLQNLISNAVKYRAPDRYIRVNVAAEVIDNEIIVSVEDNGIGIETQYHKRIFGIFKRLHTRQEYSGTGIGLTICKRIVEWHGGRIWLESVPGKGTCFYFSLPIA